MKSFSILIFIIWLFSASAFAQEAELFDEFGYIPCGDFNARMDATAIQLQQNPNSKLYVIYYGAKNRTVSVQSESSKKWRKEIRNPHPEDAINHAKEVPLYLTTVYKTPNERIILVNGGFREESLIQLWLIPNGANPPTPKPTIDKKNVKFSTKRAYVTRECSKAYDRYDLNLTRQINSLDSTNCNEAIEVFDDFLFELASSPDSIGYVIVYDGLYIAGEKNKKYIKKQSATSQIHLLQNHLENLRKNQKAEDIPDITDTKIFYISGGFQNRYSLDFWIVQKGNKIPEIKSTVDINDKKYKGLKNFETSVNCGAGAYSNLPK